MTDRSAWPAAHTIRTCLFVLAIVAGQGLGAGARERVDDLASFLADLDALIVAVGSADGSEIPALRQRVPSEWRVTAGDQQFDVPTAWLAERLDRSIHDPRQWGAGQKAIVSRLQRMRAEAESLWIPGAAAAGPSREALTRVLARPEFQRTAASVWMETLRAWLLRALANLLDRLGASGISTAGAARILSWIVGLVALVALSAWLVTSLRRTPGRRSLGLAPPVARRRSARSWAAEALEALASGRDREAARCAYHAAVAQLEEEGAWRQDESRTPREYLRLLPASHRRRTILAEVTARFERAWYGAAPGVAADARELIARLKDMGCLADRAI